MENVLVQVKASHNTVQAIRSQLWRVREEISTNEDGLVFRDRQMIIPQRLWDKVVDLAHQGHQGAAKTKARLRAKVWFPGMERLVDEKVRQCHSCTITSIDPPTAPVITEDACESPWTCLSFDFGSFPDGRLTAVIIDSHTKFPVVELVDSTAFPNIGKTLDKVFSLLGTPEEIKTDNGPPFQGQDFQTYLQ